MTRSVPLASDSRWLLNDAMSITVVAAVEAWGHPIDIGIKYANARLNATLVANLNLSLRQNGHNHLLNDNTELVGVGLLMSSNVFSDIVVSYY